ncbi:VPEID-CTERM sorting domain-containing protein [Tabrizicola piscis]|jgi:hypothetical protein|uniref:VPEID-CTERM sorting domain-containing protein n=1 Tax=Tabrizicola piscis TaxID=2494374 RepID=A0A3S8U5H3_9RHOB|nr:VPEID-CTERM sorting domain-containing protein [Tabrizicola piscis]AZL58808.1 VPEID-CTERM sorting domain-containing protein [Tabrizicola piscis]
MNKIFASLTTSGLLLAVTALPALAQRPRFNGNRHSVPEIDASAGLLAIAAVLAIMAFVWERNRRAA